MITKIQNLNGTHNERYHICHAEVLFMITKIQNLNGTHNLDPIHNEHHKVVYDYKDTKFEWNSQHRFLVHLYYFCCL